VALISCPDCQESVSDLAPACPKCGRPLHFVAPDPSRMVSVGPEKKASTTGRTVGIGCLVIIGALIILGAIGSHTPENPRISRQVDCEMAIERQLKAPKTASFDDWSDMGTVVTGTVTSQNAFGAKLTKSVRCTFDGMTLQSAVVIE